MSFKVVLPLEVTGESEKYIQTFRELGVEFINKKCRNEADFIKLAMDADAVITVGSIQPVTRNIIKNMEKCKLISNTQIGYDSIDVETATEQGILVTNVPDYCMEEVSDHAMALILSCSRRIIQLNEASKRGQWGLSSDGVEIQSFIWPYLSRLKGQILGLFGFGKVAKTMLPKAKGFGLRIISYDPYVPHETFKELGVEKVDFDTIVKQSDFLSIHAPLTSETKHIFGQDVFKKMKPTACLINTSRGSLVDNRELGQVLKRGIIAMAALDVTDPEPPKSSDPLFSQNNCILTAHSAFFSPISEAERWNRPAEEVIRITKNEWPKEIVNPKAKDKYILKWGSMSDPNSF